MSSARKQPRSEPRSVAVIGGGWAGCAAAVLLADSGSRVTLFEAARTLGGRARAVHAHGRVLDNGQHILLGAYDATLKVLRRVGIDPASSLLRLPLQMRYPPASGLMDFAAPRLPAPLHMLAALFLAKGLDRDDKLALARFTTTARWMDWRLGVDCSVEELLERYDQTPRLAHLLWRPLCVAALNTPAERASANVFLAVLRDSLGAHRAASDMLLPRVTLDALFPEAAQRHLEQRGAQVLAGRRVEAIAFADGRWRVDAGSGQHAFDAVVLATPPWQTAALVRALPGMGDTAAMLDALAYEPITTVYLQYAPGLRLPLPFCALADDPGQDRWGQFVFDRGQLAGSAEDGLLSVVVSAAGDAAALGHDALSAAVARQLADAFGEAALGAPAWTQVITEKRATFSCTPDLARPANATALPGLVLAGDYTASDYPATLETAVRSAQEAARLIKK